MAAVSKRLMPPFPRPHPSPRGAPPLSCPSGHALALVPAEEGDDLAPELLCDGGCGGSLRAAAHWSCAPCDFDCCEACAPHATTRVATKRRRPERATPAKRRSSIPRSHASREKSSRGEVAAPHARFRPSREIAANDAVQGRLLEAADEPSPPKPAERAASERAEEAGADATTGGVESGRSGEVLPSVESEGRSGDVLRLESDAGASLDARADGPPASWRWPASPRAPLELHALRGAIGQRARVWYTDSLSSMRPAAHRGTVCDLREDGVYIHLDLPLCCGRMVREGVWVDGADDWTLDGPPPPSVEMDGVATGADDVGPLRQVLRRTRAGEAGMIDQIFLARGTGSDQELFVKWKGEAHIHSSWVPRSVLEAEPNNRRRVQRFFTAGRPPLPAAGTSEGEPPAEAGAEEQPFNPEFVRVERVVAAAPSDDGGSVQYLVKWASLPYAYQPCSLGCGRVRVRFGGRGRREGRGEREEREARITWPACRYAACTWETSIDLLHARQQIERWQQQRERAAQRERARRRPAPRANSFVKLIASPSHDGGHVLRSYQLEGVNWLLKAWHARRSVILADEMGLGKTAQSIAVLDWLARERELGGPYLVVAPVSTLQHWRREVERWSALDAVVYHGDRASRELIRKYEFHHAAESLREARRAPPRGGEEEGRGEATRWMRRCGACAACLRPPCEACAPCAAAADERRAVCELRVCSSPVDLQAVFHHEAAQAAQLRLPFEQPGDEVQLAVERATPAQSSELPLASALPLEEELHPPLQACVAAEFPSDLAGVPPVAATALPAALGSPTRREKRGGREKLGKARARARGKGRVAAAGVFKGEVLITSYEVLREDLPLLRQIGWRYMVVDEAHRLKNADSALAQDLRTLQVDHTHLLTGTPLQNNTTELWALLNFVDPARFASLEDFLSTYGNAKDATRIDALRDAMQPYVLRRRKHDVETSLAPLSETIIWVELTRYQKMCYRALLEGKRELLVGGVSKGPAPAITNLQMELRKCCNHPYLIKQVETADAAEAQRLGYVEALMRASGKLILLDKLLPKLKAEGHRVLIFSQMVKTLDILAAYLEERSYTYERLQGNVRADARQAAMDRFCSEGSEIFVFLLSTRAGGVGINLTAADTCIIFDSDWNPQNDVQAMARSHRIGQLKDVKVFRLVTRNTYEQELVCVANQKLGLEKALSSSGRRRENGPPSESAEVERLLKRGAHDILLSDDDSAFTQFSQSDIEQILSAGTTVAHDQAADSSSTIFSKAAFSAEDDDTAIDDVDFWAKVLPAAKPALSTQPSKRQSKQTKRWGLVQDIDDEFSESEDEAPEADDSWQQQVLSEAVRRDDMKANRRRLPPEERQAMNDEKEVAKAVASLIAQIEAQVPEEEVDTKLWKGAAACGWKIFGIPGRAFNYVSPDLQMMQRRNQAMMLRPLPDGGADETSVGDGLPDGLDLLAVSSRQQQRRVRCGSCAGCMRTTLYCGSCHWCRDKPQFGGKGLLPAGRSSCVLRQCEEVVLQEVASLLARVVRTLEQGEMKRQREMAKQAAADEREVAAVVGSLVRSVERAALAEEQRQAKAAAQQEREMHLSEQRELQRLTTAQQRRLFPETQVVANADLWLPREPPKPDAIGVPRPASRAGCPVERQATQRDELESREQARQAAVPMPAQRSENTSPHREETAHAPNEPVAPRAPLFTDGWGECDDANVDARLWAAAAASGWRVARNKARLKYRAPWGQTFTSRDACLAARPPSGFEGRGAPSSLVQSRGSSKNTDSVQPSLAKKATSKKGLARARSDEETRASARHALIAALAALSNRQHGDQAKEARLIQDVVKQGTEIEEYHWSSAPSLHEYETVMRLALQEIEARLIDTLSSAENDEHARAGGCCPVVMHGVQELDDDEEEEVEPLRESLLGRNEQAVPPPAAAPIPQMHFIEELAARDAFSVYSLSVSQRTGIAVYLESERRGRMNRPQLISLLAEVSGIDVEIIRKAAEAASHIDVGAKADFVHLEVVSSMQHMIQRLERQSRPPRANDSNTQIPVEVKHVMRDMITHLEREERGTVMRQRMRFSRKMKENQLWARALRQLQCERDEVPSLLQLSIVKCARALVDVSRAPLQLQRYVFGLRDWHKLESEKERANQRQLERARQQQKETARQKSENEAQFRALIGQMSDEQIEIRRCLHFMIAQLEDNHQREQRRQLALIAKEERKKRKEDNLWARALKQLQSERDGVPSLVALSIVKCARSLVDVSAAPLHLRRYVHGVCEWHQKEEKRIAAQQRTLEQRRLEQARFAQMTPEQREAHYVEMAVHQVLNSLIGKVEAEEQKAAHLAARAAAQAFARSEAIKARAERNLSLMDEDITAEHLPKLEEYVVSCGGDASMVAGWYMKKDVRADGCSAGTTDLYFFDPLGKKFRSRAEIARYLQLEGAPAKKRKARQALAAADAQCDANDKAHLDARPTRRKAGHSHVAPEEEFGDETQSVGDATMSGGEADAHAMDSASAGSNSASNRRADAEMRELKALAASGSKKGRNAFHFYSAARRSEVTAANPTLSYFNIRSLLAEQFRALPAEARKPFEDLAANDKYPRVRLKLKYPPGESPPIKMPRLSNRTLVKMGGLASSSVSADEVVLPPVTWMSCDECAKWRRLGRQHGSHLPEHWTCADNPDPNYRSCDVPQELPDEEIDRELGLDDDFPAAASVDEHPEKAMPNVSQVPLHTPRLSRVTNKPTRFLEKDD